MCARELGECGPMGARAWGHGQAQQFCWNDGGGERGSCAGARVQQGMVNGKKTARVASNSERFAVESWSDESAYAKSMVLYGLIYQFALRKSRDMLVKCLRHRGFGCSAIGPMVLWRHAPYAKVIRLRPFQVESVDCVANRTGKILQKWRS